MRLRKRISQIDLYSGIHPKGYGIAYHEIGEDTVIMYPIPINLIVGFIRNIFHWILAGISPSILDNIYDKGYLVGKRENIDSQMKYAENRIRKEEHKKLLDHFTDYLNAMQPPLQPHSKPPSKAQDKTS